METLSVHVYVSFALSIGLNFKSGAVKHVKHVRWYASRFKRDLFREVIDFRLACLNSSHLTCEQRTKWMAATFEMACDSASNRVKYGDRSRSRYWWNEEIAECRRECIVARRRLTRVRRRNDPVLTEECNTRYKEVRRRLRLGIKKSKVASWNELIAGIDTDPWGFPYRLVMGKLRQPAPMLTETLEGKKLEELFRSLFPSGEVHDPIADWAKVEVPLNDARVSSLKVRAALERGNTGKVPGPDGVTLGFLRCMPDSMVEYVAETFSRCLSEGIFPRQWKRSCRERLVLIPKGKDNTSDGIIRVRPICLLNDIGKLLERIIVSSCKSLWRTPLRLVYPIDNTASGGAGRQ